MKSFVSVTPYYYKHETKMYEKALTPISINRNLIAKIFPYHRTGFYEIRMVGESSEDWIKIDEKDYLEIVCPTVRYFDASDQVGP
jgi:hypothetical protein